MIIIKIGGGEKINIEAVAKDLLNVEEKVIIVHGANALRDKLCEELGIKKNVITSASGYSSVFTDEKMIDAMMLAYSGLKNKRIVESFRKNGLNAIGLTGLDGGLICGERNKGIRVRENGKLMIKRDYSGKPRKANVKLLNLLLENGLIPVITVPIADEEGNAINTENDDVVRLLQKELNPEKIVQLIEAKGFLKDPSDENSKIDEISKTEIYSLEEKSEGRIKRKMMAIRKMLENGNTTIFISDGRIENPVTSALKGLGTKIE